jgi:hypothetical protein
MQMACVSVQLNQTAWRALQQVAGYNARVSAEGQELGIDFIDLREWLVINSMVRRCGAQCGAVVPPCHGSSVSIWGQLLRSLVALLTD